MTVTAVATTPRLTILVITWNGWGDTRRCLESIAAFLDPEHEVLVVDNASADGTPDEIERLFPFVRVTRNPENLGHTRAVNQGIAMAQGEYVLLMDSDTELPVDSVSLMLDFLQARPEVGAVAPRTYNTDGSVQQSARRFPSAVNGLFGRQSVLTRLFPGNVFSRRYLQSDELASTAPYEVDQVSGACMLFRRSLRESVGPWDEGYFAYWVDTDWCYKMHQRGWKLFCVPQASVVHHEQNRAGRKKSARRIWAFHYGAYRFYRVSRTFGVLDPRAIVAFLLLGARGLFQLAQNAFVASPPPEAGGARNYRHG
jgi:GT2 family glycosyltransferase